MLNNNAEISFQKFDYPFLTFCRAGSELNIVDFNNPKRIMRLFLDHRKLKF